MSVLSDITSVIGLVTIAKELADKLKNLELKEIIVDLQRNDERQLYFPPVLPHPKMLPSGGPFFPHFQ